MKRRLLPQQNLLFSPKLKLPHPLRKYELLFENLNTLPLESSDASEGRRPISKPAILKSFIYRNLKAFTTLYSLAMDLIDNQGISTICGLPQTHNIQTLVERLSSFLKNTPNHLLQEIRKNIILELIALGEIKGISLAIDSSCVYVQVKENNLNSSVKDRFDKFKFPKGDPDARLSVHVEFPKPFKKEIKFFWGYRNHVIWDAKSELPVTEITKPANVSEQSLFIPLFAQTQIDFNFSIEEVLADAGYDAEYLLNFVVNDLKAKPFIAKNLRWSAHSDVKVTNTGLTCAAGFPMIYWGKFKDRGKIRLKYVCPITHSKSYAKKYIVCPWNHPKFIKGKGCFAYRRGDADIRNTINYGSAAFKTTYHQRSSAERGFSRLLTFCMQTPSVRGLNAIANCCTIAHITVLLIALTAVKSGNKDKIRFIRKFLPNLH
jgi:transposase